MPSTINASTSSGIVSTADTSGVLELQSNGTTKLSVLSTGVSGTLVQGTAVASTSGTNIDFTGIPSWVKRITVMFDGVSTNGTSAMIIQLGDSGGFETTGYVSTGEFVEDNGAGVAFTAGFGLNNASAAAANYRGIATICLFGSNTWVYQSMLNNAATAMLIGAGSKTLSDTLTQVRITTVNGTDTFDAGSINIQYEG
jgi:hypothetical protein